MRSADWSRTCERCRYVKAETWPVKGSYHEKATAYRCFAPGDHIGYHIGTDRFLPYIPAWCPIMRRNEKP